MVFSYRDGLALLQLLIFVPATPFAILLCIRHGFRRSAGWRFLLIFLLVRIAGAIAHMVTISHPTDDAYATVIVCNSIGLAPLNLLCLGFLSRLNDQITNRIPRLIIRGIEILSLVGLILAITGGAGFNSNGTNYGTNPVSKASIAVFIAVFVGTIAVHLVMLTRRDEIPSGERRLLIVVSIAEPLILVRLVYALLYVFGAGLRFNSTFGNVTIYLCMAVLEEIGVIVVATGVGMTLKRLPKPATGEQNHELKAEEGQNVPLAPRDQQPASRPKIRGPITWTYYKIKGRI